MTVVVRQQTPESQVTNLGTYELKSRDCGFQLSDFCFTTPGFPCVLAHRRVVGGNTLGVLTGSKPHEAGNRTSCNSFSKYPLTFHPFTILT